LYDLSANQYTIYNKERSLTRVSPDSTYKVYDSLIALETNIITKDQNTIDWNSTKYPYEVWNRNQNLSSALKNSVNWYFQELDKKIGRNNLQNYFTRMNYGNCDLSGDISSYWLESSLKISPVEQVQLLKAFYTNELQFNKLNIDTVKSALLLSERNGASLSGKTGSGTVNQKNMNGWFIGYVESKGNTYVFATNIQSGTNPCGSEAEKITLSILNAKKIYSN
jgi:bla regulator protein BlaR1